MSTMEHPTHATLSLSLAWEFTDILPGDFERARDAVAGKKFPILGPRPSDGSSTQPLENKSAKGPFIYAIYSSTGQIKYIGKTNEKTVLCRWVRPDKRTGLHQWSHGTTSATKKATIDYIADELRVGQKTVCLYFSNAVALRSLVVKRAAALGVSHQELAALSPSEFVYQLERFLIYTFQPPWNTQSKSNSPTGIISKCGNYWSV